ncbi:MAG: alcohol dehydrogenase catalytic domain-containing protein [Planctomyces sp.]|nr:alcohol dehydrogenase catalytic domain-containing protein [Planctomyces sp.]
MPSTQTPLAKMRAVLFDRVLQYRSDAVLRSVSEGEVVVDVRLAGICETDLQLCRGYMGFSGILGHEFVGIARTGRFAGQRVVGEINCSCHACALCRRGLERHCSQRTVIGILNHDGAFAESVVVPESNLHLIPESVTDEVAVFVEPVAAACRIPEQIVVDRQNVTVLGDGRLGNLCAQVLRHHGALVTVVGKHEAKLRLLRQIGIKAISLQDLSGERTSDIVVDCTGSSTGLETAVRIVRPCGTIVLKTTIADRQTMHMAPLVIDEITMIGSRCGPFGPALRLLEHGSVSVTPMISGRYKLEDAIEAFERASRKDTLKVLLQVAED